MTLKTLIWEYRYILVALLGLLIYALLEWQAFKVKAYAVMLQAKSLAKDAILNSGDEQAEYVVKKLYLLLPVTIKVFVSEDLLRKIVYYLYHEAKDYLDDGKINNSIK